MVFSKLVNNMTSLLSSKESTKQKNISRSEQVITNELQQGLVLLNNRKNALAKLNNSLLLENFKVGNKALAATSTRELEILGALQSEYQAKISEYSTNYKTFMENYYRSVEDVKKCKANCFNSHPYTSANYSLKRQGCQAGCSLKGPYIQSCQDTYLKSQTTSQNCSAITRGKCLNGNVVLGQESTVTSSSYADSNGTTIKDGCCACGGGAGGPPSVLLRGKNIKNCNQVPGALGFGGAYGGYAASACYGAYMPSANTNLNLYKDYSALAAQNTQLMNLAKKIFAKINELKAVHKNVDGQLTNEEKKLKNQLALYGNVYANILSSSGMAKNWTLDAQVEDISLKEKSQSMRFLLWGSLATLVILMAVERMRK